MRLIHTDPKIAEAQGVIERHGVDAKEILATGQYIAATDEPAKEAKPAKEKPAKEAKPAKEKPAKEAK